jgi:hypothetical protein
VVIVEHEKIIMKCKCLISLEKIKSLEVDLIQTFLFNDDSHEVISHEKCLNSLEECDDSLEEIERRVESEDSE